MEKLLIIEESPELSDRMAASINSKSGITVEKAGSLAQAKSILSESGEEFFCALVDVEMPGSPHTEAIEYLREFYPELSLVAIANKINNALREDILQLEVADYVLKSGNHSLDYITSLVVRLYKNPNIQVLVVDDSRMARLEMSRLLRVQRYDVLEISSGEAVFSKLESHPRIKLVLMDCFMEGISGMAATAKIRELYSKDKLAVIGVSCGGSQNISADFIKSGANDFLTKPFLPEEFYCRVNQNVELIEQHAAQLKSNDLKNVVMGMAAHDVRGPVGCIRSLAKQLLKKVDIPDQYDRMLNMIVNSCTDVVELMDSLLNIAVVEDGKVSIKPEEVCLSTLVKDRIAIYQSQFDHKHIRVTSNLPLLSKLVCDPYRIVQVVDNLISNALKYSPLSNEVNITLFERGGWQQFEVIDRGCGIAEENIPKLFAAYQRFNNETTGGESSTGLGLVICKNFIEAHHGTIGYKRPEGGGSCFYFMLPTAGLMQTHQA